MRGITPHPSVPRLCTKIFLGGQYWVRPFDKLRVSGSLPFVASLSNQDFSCIAPFLVDGGKGLTSLLLHLIIQRCHGASPKASKHLKLSEDGHAFGRNESPGLRPFQDLSLPSQFRHGSHQTEPVEHFLLSPLLANGFGPVCRVLHVGGYSVSLQHSSQWPRLVLVRHQPRRIVCRANAQYFSYN